MSDRALIAAGLSLLAAVVHAGLAPHHLAESVPLGIAFALAAAGQTACTIAFTTRGISRPVAVAGIALNVAILICWATSRTVGLPVAEHPWVPEPVAALDVLTALVEVGICLLLIKRPWRWAENAGLASGAALVCLLVSGMAVHPG
jgi:hypothetical protein